MAIRHAPLPARRFASRGAFSLIELLIVVAIVGTVATVAIPALLQVLQGMKVKKARAEIAVISFDISMFERSRERLPESLDELASRASRNDPWGNPYVYRTPESNDWNAKRRRDRFLNPINHDYDLYSVGKDGESRAPLPPPVSHDDVIRANSGGYIGLAWKF